MFLDVPRPVHDFTAPWAWTCEDYIKVYRQVQFHNVAMPTLFVTVCSLGLINELGAAFLKVPDVTAVCYGTLVISNAENPSNMWYSPVIGLVYVWKGKISTLKYNIVTNPPHRSSLCFTLPVSHQEIVRDPAGVAIMPQQLPGVFYSELLLRFTQVDDLVLDLNAGVGGLCAAALLNSRNCIATESSSTLYTSLIAHLCAIEFRPSNWCYLQISQLVDENNTSTQSVDTASLDVSATAEPL